MPYTRLPTPPRRSRIPVVWIVCIVAALVLVGAALYATDHVPFWSRQQPKPGDVIKGSDNATKGEQTTGNNSDANQTNNQGTNSSTKDDGTSANGPLVAPSGNFVSNHRPSLSNSPSGSGFITSTCTTTPGASCQITFTKDGVTKSLPAQTTDAGGSTYWNNWRPEDYGLSEGSWTITAIAKSGTQTKTADDALMLEVGQ